MNPFRLLPAASISSTARSESAFQPVVRRALAFILLAPLPMISAGAQFDIHGPPGSGVFGNSVHLLDNGNFVVADPLYDAPGPIVNVGAVHLYGPAGNLISTLTGSTPEDRVGEFISTIGSRFVVGSPRWDDGTLADVGALTWVDGSVGLSGIVTVTNSLIGSSSNDRAGQYIRTVVTPQSTISDYFFISVRDWDSPLAQDVGAVVLASFSQPRNGRITASNALVGSHAGDLGFFDGARMLGTGKYTLHFPDWDNGGIVDAGAVTFIDPQNPPTGPISATNSLVGSSIGDAVGYVEPLANGNYVVRAPRWNNGGVVDAGAVVWADGNTGITGTITAGNALVGSRAGDLVGSDVVALVGNGHYVVLSPDWDSADALDVGAATWGNGATGVAGSISMTNSFVGAQASDRVGSGATLLNNGNYVISSFFNSLGAVTWGNGLAGVSGVLSVANSLVGTTPGDAVGQISALENGHYVVASPNWGPGDRGAVTWCNGTAATVGAVSAANSLVGSSDGDQIGSNVVPLSNGHYVVASPMWDDVGAGIVDAGAVTHVAGDTSVTGVLQASQSLIGGSAGDRVGGACIPGEPVCVHALAGGRYIVFSPKWDNAGIVDAGAVTWSNGSPGAIGTVSATNSLVGSSTGDRVGESDYFMQSSGYPEFFLAQSYLWDDGAVPDVGAITLFGANGGPTGAVSETNSLIGSTADDQLGLGSGPIFPWPTAAAWGDDHFFIQNVLWDNAAIVDAGSITLGHASTPLTGHIDARNSVLSTVPAVPGQYAPLRAQLDIVRDHWIVGRPLSNIVTLFDFVLFADGFE